MGISLKTDSTRCQAFSLQLGASLGPKRGYRCSLMTSCHVQTCHAPFLLYHHCMPVCTVHHTHHAGHALCRQKSTFLLKVSILYWASFLCATYVPAVQLNVHYARKGAADVLHLAVMYRCYSSCTERMSYSRLTSEWCETYSVLH